MDVYGLTGGIGSGKSTVASLLEEYGIPVVSADELSRVVVAPGSEGLREVVEEFGPQVLDERGELDRASMATVVFRDPEKRRRLEEILHPRIRERFEQVLDALEKCGHDVAIYEVPLLFEKNLQGEMKAVILVTAPERVRVSRVRARDDVTETEVRARMSAQMDEAQKRKRADYVIENDGKLDELRREVEFLLARFLRVPGIVHRGPATDEPASPTPILDVDPSYDPIATPTPSRRLTEVPTSSARTEIPVTPPPTAEVAVRTGSTLPPGPPQPQPSPAEAAPEAVSASHTVPAPGRPPTPSAVRPPSAPPLRKPDTSKGGGTQRAAPGPVAPRRPVTVPAPSFGPPTPPPPPTRPASGIPQVPMIPAPPVVSPPARRQTQRATAVPGPPAAVPADAGDRKPSEDEGNDDA